MNPTEPLLRGAFCCSKNRLQVAQNCIGHFVGAEDGQACLREVGGAGAVPQRGGVGAADHQRFVRNRGGQVKERTHTGGGIEKAEVECPANLRHQAGKLRRIDAFRRFGHRGGEEKKPGQGGMGGGALQGIFPPHHRGEGDGGLIGKTQGEITTIFQYNYPIFTDDFIFRMDPRNFERLRSEYQYRREIYVD